MGSVAGPWHWSLPRSGEMGSHRQHHHHHPPHHQVSRETFRSGETCGSSCSTDPPCFPIFTPSQGDSRLGRGQCIGQSRIFRLLPLWIYVTPLLLKLPLILIGVHTKCVHRAESNFYINMLLLSLLRPSITIDPWSWSWLIIDPWSLILTLILIAPDQSSHEALQVVARALLASSFISCSTGSR